MRRLLLILCVTAVGTLGSAGHSNAQNLQDGQANLQQRTGQTQDTGRLQNQTAPLQTNNSGGLLTQTQPGSLSVVSSPTQAKPDVTVNASKDTTNTPGQTTKTNQSTWRILALLSILGLVTSLYIYSRTNNKRSNIPIEVSIEKTSKEIIEKPKRVKKSKAKKKKKKAHHH